VKQAEIALEGSEANYNEAKRRFNQINALYGSGAASKEEYETALKAMNDFKNQVELSVIQLGNALNSLNDFDANRNDQIKDQRNQVESSKADIANIKDKIEKCTIKSSIDGRIVQLGVKPNQYPTMDNSIVAIYDLSKFKVNVQVSQYDAVSINLGQRSTVKVKGIDTEYKGTVTAISDAAIITMEGSNKEPKVKIEITLDNPDNRIKAGFEADIDITLEERLNTAAVGFESVLEDEEGKRYVFTVVNNKAVKRFVKTGLETDFDIQVLEGLKTGEQYIKNPPSTLKDGDPVKQLGGKKSDNKS
ncbi:MAG TPA: efflux RND transporter periplasmic adaptor subunit, partial [Bacillota bacterium]|nr:efflux RND transporter periplasmic adaptor subunit [Bacillota bacterium]